jgi:hypothetical protein
LLLQQAAATLDQASGHAATNAESACELAAD